LKPVPAWLPEDLRRELELVRPAWAALEVPAGSAAVILGSGLGPASERFETVWERGFEELGLRAARVAGHKGRLILARGEGTPLLFLSGRLHRYEGHPDSAVLLPHAALALLDPKAVLVTNAAGALDPGFEAGDFMRITDILSSQWRDPLRGEKGAGPVPLKLFDDSLAPGLARAAREGGVALCSYLMHYQRERPG